MLTEKDYCDYETCVALAKLGFPRWELPYDILSKKYYLRLYDAQKWLREEKKIEANTSFDKEDDGWIAFIQRLDYPDLCDTDVFSTVYDTYESALLISIKGAVKILNEENNENNL